MRLLSFCFIFIFSYVKADDSIVFCKKANSAKEYKVALNKFPFKVISTDGTRFDAMICDVNDSVVVFHVRKKSKEARKNVLAQRNRIYDYRFIKGMTDRRFDSLVGEVQKEIYKIEYPEERVIRLSAIKKLKHSNGFIPEKVRVINGIGVGALGLGFVGLGLSGVFHSGIPGAIGVGIWVADIAFGFAVQNKRLNLKRNWKIKRVIRT